MGRVDHLRNRRLLDAYADGELDPGRDLRVLTHLLVCPRCRRELALTDRIKAHLSLRRLAAFERE